MGYFSNLAEYYIPHTKDHSVTSPQLQLEWRLNDLQDRLAFLSSHRHYCDQGVSFTENELRYILPEHLKSPANVRAAIDLALRDLADRYSIYLEDAYWDDTPVMDEITGMQISFFDVSALQSQCMPLSAA